MSYAKYNVETGEVEIINDKKKKEQDPIDEILEIYRKEAIKYIDEITDKKIQDIRKSSKLGKIFEKVFNQSQKEIKNVYPDNYEIMKNKIYISFDNDDVTQREIDDLIEIRNKQIENYDEKIKKVKALLAIAETYEQKIEILKNYEILDEDGIL